MSFDLLTPLELAWLASENRLREPDPCRVCGHAVSVAASGPDGTVYRCASDAARFLGKDGPERDDAERHYRQSQQILYTHGDSRVLALIAEVRERRQNAGEPAYPAVGELYCPYGSDTPRQRYLGEDRFEYVIGGVPEPSR